MVEGSIFTEALALNIRHKCLTVLELDSILSKALNLQSPANTPQKRFAPLTPEPRHP